MKIIRRIEIATILVVALNLIFEFLFHISIKIIPKFFIVSLCTVVLFLTSVVSVFLHLSKNKSKIFKYSCKAIISLYNVPLVKTQMKKIIVTAKTLYSHPKNVSKIYAALHTDLAW